jgi:hypothetical protein
VSIAASTRARASSNCSTESRMCEWRHRLCGKDSGRLHRRSVVQVAHDGQRTDREPPGPARSHGIVLGDSRDLGDPEDRLPDRRIEHGELTRLDRRALRRRMGHDRVGVHARVEGPVAAPTHEEPVRQRRSITPAIA